MCKIVCLINFPRKRGDGFVGKREVFMKRKKFGWRKLAALGTCAVTALSFAFGLGLSDISLGKAEESDSANSDYSQNFEGGGTDKVVSNYAASNLIYDSTSKLYTFADGESYWYTDYAEGVKFADPASTTKPETDLVVVEIDTSANKGSKNNPWVITSKDDWSNFVVYAKTKKVGTVNNTATSCLNEHFVLNSDLDYANDDGTNGDILAVARFSGSFYGMGHVISNAKLTKGTPAEGYDPYSTGLFGYVYSTHASPMAFSDLVLNNITIDETGGSGHVGVLMGHASANLTVTAVTVRADINSVNPRYGTDNYNNANRSFCGDEPWREYGGIIAAFHGSQRSLNLYKCSVDLEYTISDNTDCWIGIGGLIGHVDGSKNEDYPTYTPTCDPNGQVYLIKEFNVFDCYSNVKCSYTRGVINTNGSGLWTGMTAYFRGIAKTTMKRCFSVYELNTPKAYNNYAPGVLGVPGENRTAGTTSAYVYEDCFGYGNHTYGSTKYTMPFLSYYDVNDKGSATYSHNNCAIYSDNVASTGYYSYYSKAVLTGAVRVNARSIEAVNTESSNQCKADKTAGLTEAQRLKNFLDNKVKSACYNPAVWDVNVIDRITSAFKPDIVETPILINRIRVSYYEYKDGQDEAYEDAYGAGETAGDWKIVKTGQSLYAPTSAQVPVNRKFLGWTTDKTGKTAPITEVQKTWHGDIKLYAVWGLADGITVGAAFAAKDGKTTAAYDDAKKIELTPTVTVNGGQSPATVMTDGFEILYDWKKNGTTVSTAGETYSPVNVDDSGTYTYDFRLRSVKEPLWFFDGLSADSIDVTINPAALKLYGTPQVKRKSDNSTVFYYGMELQELVLEDAQFVVSSNNNRVAGTASFKGNYKLNIEDAEEDGNGKKGLKVGVRFTPESNNYETTDVNIFIYPQILELKFELSYSGGGSVDHTLITGLEYGNNNTAAKIASDFEAAYTKFLNDYQDDVAVMRSVEGKRPYIVGGVDGATESNPMSLDEYKTSGASIDGPTDAVTIKISLLYEEYDVTIDADNGEDPVITKKYGYGMRISQSDWPGGIQPAKEGHEFLGWYVADGEGNLTSEEWDPNVSRVNKSVNIKASWFMQTLTLDRLEVSGADREGVFVADTPLQDGDLTVVAVYRGKNSKGEDVEVRKTLSLGNGGYTLKYQNGNAPYVNAPEVTVSYTDGKTVSETVTLEHVSKKKYEVKQNSFRSVSYSVDDAAKRIPEISSADMGRNGYLESVTYIYSEGGVEIPRDDVDLTRKATYWITARFTLRAQYQTNYYVEDIQISLEIYEGKTALTVKWNTDTLMYSGAGQHPTVTLMLDGAEFIPSADDNIELEYVITGSSVSENGDTGAKEAIVVGSYQVEVRIVSNGYVLKDGTDADEQLLYNFNIEKAKLAKPTTAGELIYTGEEQSVKELLGTTYNDLLMSLAQQHQATDAGSYRASITLRDMRNSEWEDGTTASVPITWQIKKQVLYATWDNTTLLLGQGSIPTVIQLEGLIGDDMNVDLTSGVLVYRGTTVMPTEVGSYQISVQLNNASLTKNYMIDVPSSIWDFVVVPDESVIVIDIEWDNVTFTFDGSSHRPIATAYDMDGNPIALTFKESDYAGDTSARWAKEGGYTITVKVPAGYFIRRGAECNYNIIANEEGKGGLDDAENPFNPDNGNKDPNGDGDNGNNNTITGLPLWQLIVGGVSALLFVVCTLKSFGEYGKYKNAKKEGKELASQSYYSFAPLPLLAMGAGVKFLGLEETPWTIIALVAAGLFLVSAVALFILSKKRKAAELVVKREQARIAEEKEFAREEERREDQARRDEENRRRDEEQARRDNEMRMMFAAMQQGGYQQQPMQYEDMRTMIAETMQAFLPAAVQQLQALPPAQSDTSGYAQPGYVSPEVESLRAQLAQQQEFINQLLQNQQAPVYEEEEPEDDISWLGENEEMISLEESYGALSDEGKRAYYEIGSYIMNKPRTSQNDGRYAVLFKYRGRTVFKLAIKDDAPVLYYPLNGGRGEVRIADPASLETAKSMIDRCVLAVDNELN